MSGGRSSLSSTSRSPSTSSHQQRPAARRPAATHAGRAAAPRARRRPAPPRIAPSARDRQRGCPRSASTSRPPDAAHARRAQRAARARTASMRQQERAGRRPAPAGRGRWRCWPAGSGARRCRRPAGLERRRRPPSRSTRSRTMAMPRPWPERSVITGLVLTPDAKARSRAAALVSRRAASALHDARADRCRPQRRPASMPRAVVAPPDLDPARPRSGGTTRRAARAAACPRARGRRAARCRGRWRCAPGAAADP